MPETVLVVEADRLLRDLLAAALGREGARVVTAPTAEVGLRRALEARPRLVVVDLLLPRMNGLDFVRQLRRQPGGRSAHAILLSALGYHEIVLQARAAGAQDFLLKPVDIDRLAAKARQALARPAGHENTAASAWAR